MLPSGMVKAVMARNKETARKILVRVKMIFLFLLPFKEAQILLNARHLD